MTARTFGRKGGFAAPAPRRGSLVAHQPRSFAPAERTAAAPAADEEMEARRAAFLDSERERAANPPAEGEPDFLKMKEVRDPRVVGPRSFLLTFLLWLLLGTLGAHRFYLGRNLSGSFLFATTVVSWGLVAGQFYLAFAGTLVSAAWVFIDGFLLKAMVRQATGKTGSVGFL
jgi:TM2 domain-containing membrane protein YozV